MRRRDVAGTDLRLSVVGFGCWAAGGQYWGPVRDEDSIAAIRAALDLGVDWFDTAPLYGHGHADEILARALGSRVRDVTIATKVGVRTDGEHAVSDLSPAQVRADAEASLRRLGVDAIDLLQTHWPCERGTPLAETLGALQDLRREGKVRWFGVCNAGPDDVRVARAHGAVTLQTPYHLLRREAEQGLRDAATGPIPSAGAGDGAPMGLLAYEPLCRGLLTGKFRSPPSFDETDQRSWDERFEGARFARAQALVRDLGAVADKVGVPTAAIAIGWVLTRPGVTAAIVGAKTPAQVAENVRAADILDRGRVWSVVDRIAALHAV